MTKNILITGGTSGIGQAAVELFVNEGWNVATIGRNPEKTTKFAENHPGVQAFIADMSKVDDIKRVMTEISSKMDHLDAFFANAGFGIFKPFLEITENDFDKQVDLNYKGTFFSIQEATKLMSKGGSIVINTSWTYHRGLKTSTLYSSSKSAVAYLTKSLALELGEKGIRVNAVSPGYTNSAQFNEKSIEVDRLAAMISRVPLHIFADASEIANVVEFLSSNKSSYINGQDIVIDGGMTVTHAEPEVRI